MTIIYHMGVKSTSCIEYDLSVSNEIIPQNLCHKSCNFFFFFFDIFTQENGRFELVTFVSLDVIHIGLSDPLGTPVTYKLFCVIGNGIEHSI
jgi:hypothetical protein